MLKFLWNPTFGFVQKLAVWLESNVPNTQDDTTRILVDPRQHGVRLRNLVADRYLFIKIGGSHVTIGDTIIDFFSQE